MSKELAKTYDPSSMEDALYKKWEEKQSSSHFFVLDIKIIVSKLV